MTKSRLRKQFSNFLILAVLGVSSIDAKARNSCIALFLKDPQIAESDPLELSLPADILSVIENFREQARSLHFETVARDPYGNLDDRVTRTPVGDGERLIFGVEFLKDNQLNLGEHLSAQFVAGVIRGLFPKATIENGFYADMKSFSSEVRSRAYKEWSLQHPGKSLVFVGIGDSNEGFMRRGLNQIEMVDIKPAIPGLKESSTQDLRRNLKIPSNAFVLSLYFKDFEGSVESDGNSNGVSEVLQQTRYSLRALNKQQPQIIFLSFGGGKNLTIRPEQIPGFEDYEIIKQSEFRKRFNPKKKYVVVNDTRGQMRQILGVSNLAIVNGPINFMEPLSERVPVIFFNNPQVLGGYNSEAFATMAQTARLSGGAFEVDSVVDIPLALTRALNPQVVITPPYLIRDASRDHLSPIERFMMKLLHTIQNGMRISQAASEY